MNHSSSFRSLLCAQIVCTSLLLSTLLLTSCGGGGGGTGTTTPPAPTAPTLALLAGNTDGGPGHNDGSSASARFAEPTGIATDVAGNFYVADTFNHTIRKISPSGAVTTLAGTVGISGSADGASSASSFNSPFGVATDRAGNVYVADTFNHTIRKITPAGVVSTLAGTAGQDGSSDGTGNAASFSLPYGVATDTAGNVFVADLGNARIRRISPTGVVSTFATLLSPLGTPISAPIGVATDSANNVYFVDLGTSTVGKITPDGVASTVAGSTYSYRYTDGNGTSASFNSPSGIAVDGAGNIYVTEELSNTVRKITPDGTVSTWAGKPGVTGRTDGAGSVARFNYPFGLAVDASGNVYTTDLANYTVLKITPQGVVSTLAGTAGITGSADGAGAAASFDYPEGVASDSLGNVYVADYFNHTIRKITPSGATTTLAGSAGVSGSDDGSGSAARFNSPRGIATDGADNVYVADFGNSTVRKITPAGVVSTLAGVAGVQGSIDGPGYIAKFNAPNGIALDSSGNIYVSDRFNHNIRKIAPTGMVSTLAGTANQRGSLDGSGSAARFYLPAGIAIDGSGNVFVADYGNATVRKITPTGTVSTFAGTPGSRGSSDGAGGAARFMTLAWATTDSAGNVYLSDTFNNCIRKITPTGVVSTLVGVPGAAGFTPGALPGSLNSPQGIAVHGNSLYIAMNNAVVVLRNMP